MENKKHKGSGSGNGEDKEDVLTKQQSVPKEEKSILKAKGLRMIRSF